MDYPLNMHHKGLVGFAKADDEQQHKALSDAGYEPKFVEPKRVRKAAEQVEQPDAQE
jgi:hypothetical protein